jgi:hypothetical protein
LDSDAVELANVAGVAFEPGLHGFIDFQDSHHGSNDGLFASRATRSG